jgi:hypothetical protein
MEARAPVVASEETAVVVYEDDEVAELIAALERSPHAELLNEWAVERVQGGGIKVGPIEIGTVKPMHASQPVIRNASTKRMVAGSGRAALKPPEEKHVVKSYRGTAAYREAFEVLCPAGGNPDERGTQAWLFDQFWQAVEGSPQYIQCPHSDCTKRHAVALKKDANAMFKMIELGVGKAAETKNVNITENRLVEVLEQRVVDVRIQGIDPAGSEARRRVIKAAGIELDDIIEAEYRVVEDDNGTEDSE